MTEKLCAQIRGHTGCQALLGPVHGRPVIDRCCSSLIRNPGLGEHN
jgi:hypothetical protein